MQTCVDNEAAPFCGENSGVAYGLPAEITVHDPDEIEALPRTQAVAVNERCPSDTEALRINNDTKRGGSPGYFADPDGHPWEIAYNPFWTILQYGRSSIKKDW